MILEWAFLLLLLALIVWHKVLDQRMSRIRVEINRQIGRALRQTLTTHCTLLILNDRFDTKHRKMMAEGRAELVALGHVQLARLLRTMR